MGDAEDEAVDFEVVENVEDAAEAGGTVRAVRLIIPPAPIHPLSSLVTVAIDQVWGVLELGATLSVWGFLGLLPLMVMGGAVCFTSVTLIQRFVDHDRWGTAFAKASAMGVVAGVPYAVVGTAVGGVLLAWAGVHTVERSVRGYLSPKSA